jgi:hypothetical protein
MSPAAEILTELQRRGVIVAIDGDTLCLKPRRALDDTFSGPRPRSQARDPRSLEERPGRLRFAALCRVPWRRRWKEDSPAEDRRRLSEVAGTLGVER